MNKEKVLKTLGLARRAGKVASGEDNVLKLLRENKLKFVFIASDTSKKQIDKFTKKCFYYNVDVNNDFTCEELSNAIGKPMCKYLGITDQGFLDALKKSLMEVL